MRKLYLLLGITGLLEVAALVVLIIALQTLHEHTVGDTIDENEFVDVIEEEQNNDLDKEIVPIDEEVILIQPKSFDNRFLEFINMFSSLHFSPNHSIPPNILNSIQGNSQFHIDAVNGFIQAISVPAQFLSYWTLLNLGALMADVPSTIRPNDIKSFVENEIKNLKLLLCSVLLTKPQTTHPIISLDDELPAVVDGRLVQENINRKIEQFEALQQLRFNRHQCIGLPRAQLLVPILTCNHFQLLQVQPQINTITCFDNMGGFAKRETENLTMVLQYRNWSTVPQSTITMSTSQTLNVGLRLFVWSIVTPR